MLANSPKCWRCGHYLDYTVGPNIPAGWVCPTCERINKEHQERLEAMKNDIRQGEIASMGKSRKLTLDIYTTT